MPFLIFPAVMILTYAGCTVVDVLKEAYDRNRERRARAGVRIVRGA